MSNVPAGVAYGQVIGRFVRFTADSLDVDDAPDEQPLQGSITLAPLTRFIRYTGVTPPRLSVLEPAVCQLNADGDLVAPNGALGVYLLATEQSQGSPSVVQWRATFSFANVPAQPDPVVFNVPGGGVVDLAVIVSVPPSPPESLVIDITAAQRAAEQAQEAAASAQEALEELHQALASPPPLEGRLSVGSSPTVDLTTEGQGTNNDPMVITGTMRPGTILDRLQVGDSSSLTLTIDGAGTTDEPAVITGEVTSQSDDNADRIDANSDLIEANTEAIHNLVGDVGAMFNRLNGIENQVNLNVANLNNIGERVTNLESQ